MEHPVTANKISVITYWFFPIATGVLQAVFNSYTHILPVTVAFVDGLTFGAVLGILGMALWYVVRYNDPEKIAVIPTIANHIAAAVIFILIWIKSSELIVKTLLNNELYLNYFDHQVSARILGGLFYYAVLVSMYYTAIYSQKNREKQVREAELQHQIRKAQLSALKFQINPHFLFNCLNSIASLTLTNPEKAHQMVISLSEFMRYSLRKQQDEMVTLEVELKNIGLYLQIEKIRFGENLDYRFDIANECNSHLIPNLILQPILENAIKYGVYEASRPVEIILKARKLSDGIEIIVINDLDQDSVPLKGEGVGLANINDRLRLLYGSSTLLHIEHGEKQFKVTLVIPDHKIDII